MTIVSVVQSFLEVSSVRGGLFYWLNAKNTRHDLIPACQKRTGFSPAATHRLTGREAWMPDSFSGNKARKGEFHS
jgi:hypothetical protein